MTVEAIQALEEQASLSRDQRMWRWRILISTYFAYGGYYLCRKVFSICKKTLAGEFGVGLDDIAHIWTAYLVAYMLGMFLNSFIGRKWGARVLLLGGFGISIIINLIFGFTNSYWTFFGFMFFNGIVQASGWPGCVGGVAEWLRKKERGTIMGFWSTNYLFGNILVKTLGGYLLVAMGWRYAFWGCTLVSFAIWWLVYFWQRNRPQDVGLPAIVVREAEAEDARAIQASQASHVTFREYVRLALNPVILVMGLGYFCIKFLRYALDSWLPTFLAIMGLDAGQASYYSTLFDFGGIIPAVLAGWALDRWFHGNWAKLCVTMALGMVIGYLTVLSFETSPVALALSFALVGFMLYGPDTILAGAAAVQVAGEKNGVAVAGMVNGMASIGPIIQEEVIGRLVGGDEKTGMHNANLLSLGLSIFFVCAMIMAMWRLHLAHKRNAAARA